MNNFKNPSRTLAFKRQCSALHSHLNKEMLCELVTFGKIFQCPRRDLPPNVQHAYPERPTISISLKMSINSTQYWKGVFVIVKATSSPSTALEFGEIDCIICEEKTSPLLVLTLYTTVEFCNDSFCYIIERKYPSEKHVCRVDDLVDFHPLDGTFSDVKLLVRKYFVW